MIKAVGIKDGKSILIVGLSRNNVELLMQDQPVHIRPQEMAEMGLPEMSIVLLFGETEEAIANDIAQQTRATTRPTRPA